MLDELQVLQPEYEECWFQLFAQHRKFRIDVFISTQAPLSLPEKMADLISFFYKTTHNPMLLKKWIHVKKIYDGIPTEEKFYTFDKPSNL